MSTKSMLTFVVAMMASVIFAVGCQEPVSDGDGHSHDGHSHSHGDHDHDHADCDCGHDHGNGSGDKADDDHPPHGPNHGHLFDLNSDEFTCEWCQYQDNNVIRFYLLDGKAQSPKPLVVEKFLVKPLVGSEGEPFELEPENVDPEGAAHSFMLDEILLRTAIPLGVEIEIVMDGKTLTGQIKAHEPLDH